MKTKIPLTHDEIATYLVTDAVCGIIHGAMDLGISLEMVREKIEMAFEHALEERRLTSAGYCSHCEKEVQS